MRFVKITTLPWLNFVILSCLTASSTSTSGIRLLNACSCSGQTVTFECVATGGFLTVWSGSAFMCSSSRTKISLRHATFLEASEECNNGAIFAEGIDNIHNRYTSHLNVTLTSEVLGSTVNCSVDGNDLVSIGSSILSINDTNTFLPPSEIFIENIGPNGITFSWSETSHINCPSFKYNISSVNCGTCLPTLTTSNVSYCTNFSDILFSSTNVCNFSVNSIICGNIAGDRMSKAILLKVPDAPIVRQSVPRYDGRTSRLIGIETNFTSVESSTIPDDPLIDGFVTSYTITYTDSTTGAICADLANVSCGNEICHHTFDISTSFCSSSTDISVSVVASNILGNSQSSTPIYQSGINTFVDVTFDPSTRSFSCRFLDQSQRDTEKQCIANVTHGANCDQHRGIYRASSMGNPVTTPPFDFIDSVLEYCFFVTAISGDTTVIVELTLNLVTDLRVTIPVVVVAVIIIISIIIIFIIVQFSLYVIYIRTSKPKTAPVLDIQLTSREDKEDMEYFERRLQAVQRLEQTDCHPYPHEFQTDLTLEEFTSKFNGLSPGVDRESETVKLAGRVYGKQESENNMVIVYEIRDVDGTKVKIMVDESQSDQKNFQELHKNIMQGDIVGVDGFPKTTEEGELKVVATEMKLLSPCLHLIQDLHIGFANKETHYRQRYLDLITNDSVSKKFRTRAEIMAFLRRFLDNDGFLEVETPMMNVATRGAMARPFNNEVKQDVFLRVAPDLHYKMLAIGGFKRVYEIGKVFRNEERDATHNPEFTSCEFLMAYADYNYLMAYMERLLSEMVRKVKGEQIFSYHPDEGEVYKVDFTKNKKFRRIRVVPALENQLRTEFPQSPSEFLSKAFNKKLDKLCKKHNISCANPRSSARMLYKLIEHFIYNECIKPTFVMDHPQILTPLAKWHRQDGSKGLTEHFELIVCKQKICNAYTMLNDPEKQRELFQKQPQAGGVETCEIDESYCKALEYGLPPSARCRIYVDQIAMLLTDSANIKDVLLFPAMEPKPSHETPPQESPHPLEVTHVI